MPRQTFYFTIFLIISLTLLSNPVFGRDPLPIPESLVFDLVEELGAKQGEIEVNSLAELPMNRSGERALEWAPEVEYMLFDGIGVEFEFPFENSDLEAYKFAAQYTFENPLLFNKQNYIDGWQIIAEKLEGKSFWEWTGLYLSGFVYDEQYSAMMMTGLRYTNGSDAENELELIVNYTLFKTYSDTWIVGLENDFAWHDADHWSLLLMPQLHYQPTEHLSLQFGSGAEFTDDDTNLTFALRLIYGGAL